jgi:hypothetical protein
MLTWRCPASDPTTGNRFTARAVSTRSKCGRSGSAGHAVATAGRSGGKPGGKRRSGFVETFDSIGDFALVGRNGTLKGKIDRLRRPP